MKAIDGYEGLYSIDREGRVFSHKSNKFLKPRMSEKGYRTVGLYLEGVMTNYYVHRLVLTAFKGLDDSKPEVNHIDGDKSNNKVDNLEWSTRSANVRHSFNTGLKSVGKGDLNHKTKYSDETIDRVHELRAGGMMHKDIASLFGMTVKYVGDILNNRVRKRGGKNV